MFQLSKLRFFSSYFSYEIIGVLFDQMKVPGTRTQPMKAEKKYFQQTSRKLVNFTGSKSNKEVNLTSLETKFLHGNPQKKQK